MNIFTFRQPEDFFVASSDTRHLTASALGAARPSVHALLTQSDASSASPTSSLDQLEWIARILFEQHRAKPGVTQILQDYQTHLLRDGTEPLNDILHHQRYAILPLLKWYQATREEPGNISTLWARHLARSQTLCFALYWKLTCPRAWVAYSQHEICCYDPDTHQSHYYTDTITEFEFTCGDLHCEVGAFPWSSVTSCGDGCKNA